VPKLNFDGVDDFVEVSHSEDLDIPDEITVMAWVKSSNLAPTNTIISKTGSESKYTTFWMDIRNSGTYILFGGYTPTGGGTYINKSYAFSTDVWYHLVGVDDGSNLIIYINGNSIGSGARATRVSGDWPVSIGSRGISSASFPGLIDEVKIYNRALSASEIAAEYAQGK